jgi:hypothetical protein
MASVSTATPSSRRSANISRPETTVRITRFPAITEHQFAGCVAAFVDSLFGELHSAAIALRRLENKGKGDAFAYEMDLDTRRYGALIVLDRWNSVVGAFGPHLELTQRPGIVEEAPARIAAAEEILRRANNVIDAAPGYGSDLVEVCVTAFQTLKTTFTEERALAEQWSQLGPMQPQEYREARQIFLEDLAAR